jgi:lysophospholipase L1-like esterase
MKINNDPTLVRGVSVPLEDRYVLIPSEISEINAARAAFNNTIKDFANANSSRVAMVDVDAAFTAFVAAKGNVMNNVTITPNINPPTGIYSEDGLHPNTRGYAFISTIFISTINAAYGAKVPLTDISLYQATGLPIP